VVALILDMMGGKSNPFEAGQTLVEPCWGAHRRRRADDVGIDARHRRQEFPGTAGTVEGLSGLSTAPATTCLAATYRVFGRRAAQEGERAGPRYRIQVVALI
jgi:hypothetical protein